MTQFQVTHSVTIHIQQRNGSARHRKKAYPPSLPLGIGILQSVLEVKGTIAAELPPKNDFGNFTSLTLTFDLSLGHVTQSHRLERIVPTGSITMFQLLIGLIQSRDNRGRHVLSSETTEVFYENGSMPVFRSCLKSACRFLILRPIEQNDC